MGIADVRDGFKAIEKSVGRLKSERARTRLAPTKVLGRFYTLRVFSYPGVRGIRPTCAVRF